MIGFVLAALAGLACVYDAIFHFSRHDWQMAELSRAVFIVGFLIFGFVSLLMALAYWTIYRRRLIRAVLLDCKTATA